MRVKDGVKLIGLRPELLAGIMICERVVVNAGFEFVITSVNDGVHSRTSLHNAGMAFDFRSREMSDGQQSQVVSECLRRLSSEFDVVLESDHFHVEYQPKS